MPLLTFQEFSLYPQLIHGFTLRDDPANRSLETAEDVLLECGIATDELIQAEQPHSNRVGIAQKKHSGSTISNVDALISNTSGCLLVIRTADCGAIFLFDPEHMAVGLAHSGRKGTATNIFKSTVIAMQQTFQTDPKQLIAVLSPCIRPPHYEVNFAKSIATQAHDAGVAQFTDCLENTAADLKRYYSYRMEQGQTGRHYAFIGIKNPEII